jgi:DNA-binding response OmpR family regulator
MAESPTGPRRTDVLLVDDSVSDVRLLMQMMTLRDLRVSVALDGVRGFEQAVALQPGLVLLDVRMPGMDGHTLCRRLKATPATRQIPVIFLTAANDVAERLEGFAVGGVDYIGKPFVSEEVLARVGVHLRRSDTHGAPASAAGSKGLPTADDVLVHRAMKLLRQRMAEPPALEDLAKQLGTNRSRLNDAFQALCGQPVFGWFREERFRQAYALVTRTGEPLGSIAYSLGFAAPATFTRSFKDRFGCAPSELRLQVRTGMLPTDTLAGPATTDDRRNDA